LKKDKFLRKEVTMRHTLVAVMNGTQARFLTVEPVEASWPEAGITLVEHDGLFNPEHELSGQELWSSAKTGRNRGTSGQAHSYDDHRDSHSMEFGRRFAQSITAEITRFTQTYNIQALILICEPQFLGLLRDALSSSSGTKTLAVTELAKDVCQLKATELHEYLVDRELLPAPKRISSV
jgi:protein required for attachment to host cells